MRTRLLLWTLPLAAWVAACSGSSALVEPTSPPADSPGGTAPATIVVLDFVAGDGQILTVGETAPEAFVVEARDPDDALLSGIPITLRATVEGGLFLPQETQSTDVDGRVSYNFQAPPEPSLLGVQASAPNAQTVFVSVESHAGSAVTLAIQLHPSAIAIGSTAAVEVVGLDRFENVAELPDLVLTIEGSAAVLSGATVEGVEVGEGMIRAQAGELRDSVSFVVFEQASLQLLRTTEPAPGRVR